MKEIKIGYEIKTGKKVKIPNSHLIVTGITQLSGKTTTLEALIKRSGLKAIVFKTKIGERGFTEGSIIPPYFKERSDWAYVQSLLEATMKERMKFERSWIIEVCKGTDSLLKVKANIDEKLATGKLNALSRSIYTNLQAYFELILPQLQYQNFSKTLQINDGINIMDLERFREEIQSLVIRSVLDTILNEQKNTIVVIPEAWKFLPQNKGNPCKSMADAFIRQGATNGNYLWIDSQDMANIDKGALKQVSTWILGLQQERNEVLHTLDQIPLPKRMKPKPNQIMTLKLGHFYVCTPSFTSNIYVQPAWLDDAKAKEVAKGKVQVEKITNTSKIAPYTLKPVQNDAKSSIEIQKLHAKFQQEMVELRQDFFNKVQALQDQMVNMDNYYKSQISIQKIILHNRKSTDEIVSMVLQKMPLQPVQQQMNKQEIIDEVLKRIPAGSGVGGAVYQVSPLDKISKDFLNNIRNELIRQINSLEADEKKILKFIEAQNKGVNVTNILERCLFLSKTSGGSRNKVAQVFKKFIGMEIARYDKAHGLIYPLLKDRIKNMLGTFKATEQEIQQVYDHIMMELIK